MKQEQQQEEDGYTTKHLAEQSVSSEEEAEAEGR